MDSTNALVSSDNGKGRIHGLKSDDGDTSALEKVAYKVDPQSSSNDTVDPGAVECNVTCVTVDTNSGDDGMEKNCGSQDFYHRPQSVSPDMVCHASRSSAYRAYDLPENDQQCHDTAPISPDHRLELSCEIEDSRDEVRSENGGIRSRARIIRGKGRGNTRPCSGSTTPLTNSPVVSTEKKRLAGRGRGSKRGRGFGSSRAGEAVDSEGSNIVLPSAADDIYEFKSSPEDDFALIPSEFGNREERERSAPPNAKKQRLVENRPESHGGSAHSGDIEMDDIEDDESNTKSTTSDRKVPPLRISLPITHSEEDMHGETTGQQALPVPLTSNRKGPRGRYGKRQNDADEAQRMTRSKVRQTGKVLDDTDAWTKKKRCRANTTLNVVGDEVDDYTADDVSVLGEGYEDTSPTGQASNPTSIPDSLSFEQRIIYENPRSGMYHLKKLLAERWLADLSVQKDRRWQHNENYENMLLLTGNYSSLRLDDDSTVDKTVVNEAEHEKEQLPVVDLKCPSTTNRENESEDESNGICAEMKVMWKEHNEERSNMMNRMYKERIKLRLFWEQELLRLEQRENGSTPRMSAVRFLRENEMCNAQILEESTEPLKPMSRVEFNERKNKSINQMFNRHRMEASSLFGLQRDMWWCEARRRGLDVDLKSLKDCVPIVKVEKMDFPY